MAKKTEEVKNGLVAETVETTAETTQDVPTQKAELNEVPVQTETPGHTTRAFRG